MVRLLFWGFVVGGIVIAYMTVMQPQRLRRLGTNARKLGYAYVAAVLISAVLRLVFDWGG